MHFSSLLAVFALVLSALAEKAPKPKYTHPNGTLDIVYPNGTVYVGERVTLGLEDPPQGLTGLTRLVNVSMTYPNGTTAAIIGVENFEGSCTTDGGYALDKHVLTVTGTYTVFWNVTYGYSADPLKANVTYCGPGPFTYQNWVLNKTFEVVKVPKNMSSATLSSADAVTVTQNFSSVPTGEVLLSSSATQHAVVRGVLVALALAAGLFL